MRARLWPPCVVLALCAAATGCGTVPGSGPWMNGAQSTSTEALPFDVIDLTPATVGIVSQPIVLDVPSSSAASVGAGGRVAVAPGDVLHVRIFEQYSGNIFGTMTSPGSDLPPQRVTDDGTIEVPYVGVVPVAGLNLSQIEDRIISQLGTKAQNPQVIVELVTDRSSTVVVSGDVKNPGRVSLLDGVRTVVDAINSRGGLANPGGTANGTVSSGNATANQMEVVLRRRGQVVLQAQYSELLAGRDIPLEKGDEIVARPNSRVFTVLGAVMRSGNVEMLKPNLTLLEALGTVGGLQDQQANKTGVYLFRVGDLEQNPPRKARVFRLDLNQPVSIFVAQRFYVQARDVVYVSNAPLYEYNKIVTQLYQTIAVFGIAKGTVIPATVF